ncbi:hypothetical protein GYMLUDRAFT_46650 [Collybiopsis luxurians FD-317 M1]|uniref:pyridoxal kinase n=1 Tax=Collybiopsis luxurians FD-317 M1 TaxID=944289 RepID=A0A0D0C3T4_9AGAR|nr:hypothetical protein GYMLUDRAFT_46650 [Collybiopsis luxurians FD-317 M1]
MSQRRVLSIQSHVAFGYVGGKAAAFPLQCLGYDVDLVNTVNFSNHSGYGRLGGRKTSTEELESIFQAMESNELLDPSRLLTGYIPNADALNAIKKLAEKLRKQNPNLIYLLDPVMGDAGKLYVSADVIPVYQSMLPLSTVITPNWFEVETLTSTQLTSLPSLRHALTILHTQYHVPHIAISSIPLKPWLAQSLPASIRPPEASESAHLLCITSSLIHSKSDSDDRHENGSSELSLVHAQCVPLIAGYFSGVGDLFSALVLAHYHPSQSFPSPSSPSPSPTPYENPNPTPHSEPTHSYKDTTPLTTAVSLSLSKTHQVLLRTFSHSESLPESERLGTDDEKDGNEPIRKVRRMKGRELRLVQSIDVIRGEPKRQKLGHDGDENEEEEGVVQMRELVRWDEFWSQKP